MNEERITSVIGAIAPNESAIGRIKENLEKKKREFKRRMFGKFKALTAAAILLFTVGILPITLFAKKINTVTEGYVGIIRENKIENPRDIFEFLEMLLENWETIYLFFFVSVILVLFYFAAICTVRARRAERNMETR